MTAWSVQSPLEFMTSLGHNLTRVSGDPRETYLLPQNSTPLSDCFLGYVWGARHPRKLARTKKHSPLHTIVYSCSRLCLKVIKRLYLSQTQGIEAYNTWGHWLGFMSLQWTRFMFPDCVLGLSNLFKLLACINNNRISQHFCCWSP